MQHRQHQVHVSLVLAAFIVVIIFMLLFKQNDADDAQKRSCRVRHQLSRDDVSSMARFCSPFSQQLWFMDTALGLCPLQLMKHQNGSHRCQS